MSDAVRFRDELTALLAERGASIDGGSLALVERYYALLQRWGAVQNLTRHLDPSSAARESFGDSWLGLLALEQACSLLPGPDLSVLDVGSGAGFPGLVAAIRWSRSPVTLVEPLKKRCSFLEEVSRQLGLRNVTVLCARVEDVTPTFALVLSRATVGVGRGYDALIPRVSPRGFAGLFVGPSLSGEAWSREAGRLGLVRPRRLSYRGEGDDRAVVVAQRPS